ncbi:hypothetical protein BLS_002874 [Venturia inaequalis]|uniref:Uncharacterized protein n=1 Tax=Venturia inaequalis TaxID=5025 RepID=A0A8H3YWW0_VENIN|nr:hypothetical protein EG328_004489 [Venturia inaequalis]KAE9974873.1 hypothetical protein BLS_002874 [Venturia inaequalis]
MRASLLLLPSLVLAVPVAYSHLPFSDSSSLTLLKAREVAGWFDGIFAKGSKTGNYYSGSDGSWDVIEPTKKPSAAQEDEPTEPKPAKAKPAPPKAKPAPPKEPVVEEEEAEEEAPAPPPKPVSKPSSNKSAAKPANPTTKQQAKTSESIGSGWNPDEPKQNKGLFGSF